MQERKLTRFFIGQKRALELAFRVDQLEDFVLFDRGLNLLFARAQLHEGDERDHQIVDRVVAPVLVWRPPQEGLFMTVSVFGKQRSQLAFDRDCSERAFLVNFDWERLGSLSVRKKRQ